MRPPAAFSPLARPRRSEATPAVVNRLRPCREPQSTPSPGTLGVHDGTSCSPRLCSRSLPVLDVAWATPAGVRSLRPCRELQSTPSPGPLGAYDGASCSPRLFHRSCRASAQRGLRLRGFLRGRYRFRNRVSKELMERNQIWVRTVGGAHTAKRGHANPSSIARKRGCYDAAAVHGND